MEIETEYDWWEVLEDNWDNILLTASKVMDLQELWKTDDDFCHITVLEKVTKAKQERDHDIMCRFLTGIWVSAPDSPEIHNYLAWNVICDLNSEDWVFNENRTMGL